MLKTEVMKNAILRFLFRLKYVTLGVVGTVCFPLVVLATVCQQIPAGLRVLREDTPEYFRDVWALMTTPY